jgi:hypothetical protein
VTKLFDRMRKRARRQGGARESLFDALRKAQERRDAARKPAAVLTEEDSCAGTGDHRGVSRKDA